MKNQKKNKNKEVHVPMRMCAVTREKLPKKQLVRFVSLKGKISVDSGERLRGRGLSIKPELEVFEEAIKRKIFERGLKAELNETEIEKLRKDFVKIVETNFREKKVIRVSSEQLSKLVKEKSGK